MGRYHELNLPTHHNCNIIEHINCNENCDLTSTGTPDTVLIVNGYSTEQNLEGKKDHDNDLVDNTHTVWGHQAKLNNEILQQLKLTQGFLHAQGKKGFSFLDKPDHYESLVTIYKEKTEHEHLNDTKCFNILGLLLDGEAEALYNRHLSEPNKTLALARPVWFATHVRLSRKQSHD